MDIGSPGQQPPREEESFPVYDATLLEEGPQGGAGTGSQFGPFKTVDFN